MFNEAFAGTLPIQGTEIAAKWDTLYYFLLWLSVFFFVFIVGAMIYFAWTNRRQDGVKPEYNTGSHLLEAIWVTIPTVLLLIIFGWGYSVYRDMKTAPSDAYEIKVIGKQWLWTFLYDNGNTSVNDLYVPVNKPVKLLMTSQDVLHGFFVPNFRVKQDAVPGMYTSIWFEATVPGRHQIFCTEYCGTSHSGMIGQVIALDDKQWKDWLRGKKITNVPKAGEEMASATTTASASASETTGAQDSAQGAGGAMKLTLAEQGKQVWETKSCNTCHTIDGSTKVGPTWKNLYGSKVELTDGTTVVADENYLRESIVDPQAKIVKGFGPSMPVFKGVLSEQEITATISFIKSLK
jgi:cytochrome c oxidase subunit 2